MVRFVVLALVACASAPVVTYPIHPPAPVAASGEILVVGAVNKPGRIVFHRGITLTEALGEAGGIAPDGFGMKLIRIEHGTKMIYAIDIHRIISEHAPDPELAPDDEIYVGVREV
jgi:protein involved in polysaccharide export with SLBB domain